MFPPSFQSRLRLALRKRSCPLDMNSVLWPTIKKGRRPLLGNGQRPPGLGGSSQIPRQIWRFLWGLRPGIPAPKSGGIRSSPLGLAKAAGYKGHRSWTRRNSEPHDHGRTRWAFGRNPRLTIKSVKIWAGPSRRPSGINALTFGRAKITLKLSSETLKQPRVSANDRP